MENLWRAATGQRPNRSDYVGIEFWSNPERSGWLFRQGDYTQTWRRRWFVLKQGKLFWFKDPSSAANRSSVPRGVISLSASLSVKSAEDRLNKPCAFEISAHMFQVFFNADNDKDKQDWMNSIGRAIALKSRSHTASEVFDYHQVGTDT